MVGKEGGRKPTRVGRWIAFKSEKVAKRSWEISRFGRTWLPFLLVLCAHLIKRKFTRGEVLVVINQASLATSRMQNQKSLFSFFSFFFSLVFISLHFSLSFLVSFSLPFFILSPSSPFFPFFFLPTFRPLSLVALVKAKGCIVETRLNWWKLSIFCQLMTDYLWRQRESSGRKQKKKKRTPKHN